MQNLATPLIALGIFLVGQLIAAVAWASAINTKMNFMLDIGKDMKNLEKNFTEAQVKYSTKDEVAKALHDTRRETALTIASAEKEIQAIWKRIDELKTILLKHDAGLTVGGQ